MKKQVVTILVVALAWSSLAFAQTFEEEMRQEKLMFRQFQAAQHSQVSFEKEMRKVKREYRAFLAAQRYANEAVTEAEEIRQLKREYRAFLTEQNRQDALAAESIR